MSETEAIGKFSAEEQHDPPYAAKGLLWSSVEMGFC